MVVNAPKAEGAPALERRSKLGSGELNEEPDQPSARTIRSVPLKTPPTHAPLFCDQTLCVPVAPFGNRRTDASVVGVDATAFSSSHTLEESVRMNRASSLFGSVATVDTVPSPARFRTTCAVSHNNASAPTAKSWNNAPVVTC